MSDELFFNLKKQLYENMKIPIKMNYVSDISNYKTRYKFSLPKESNLYNILLQLTTHCKIVYSYPWKFNEEGECMITLMYPHKREYQSNESYNICMSMNEFNNSHLKLHYYSE